MAELDKYFAGKYPVVREIYDTLILRMQQELERISIQPKRFSLHIVAKTAFLGISFMKSRLRINIILDRKIAHKNLHKAEQVFKHRFHNQIDLFAATDIDIELMKLIREAYDLHNQDD